MSIVISQSVITEIKSSHSAKKLEKFMAFKDNEFSTNFHYGGKVAVSNSPEHQNSIFLIEKKMQFKGRAIGDHTYSLSMYDKDGNFIKDMSPDEYDYEFIKKLIYVE